MTAHEWQVRVAVVLALTSTVALLDTALIVYQSFSIDKLNKRVACLEHPHGESSISATKVNGKWHVSKPTRTGC